MSIKSIILLSSCALALAACADTSGKAGVKGAAADAANAPLGRAARPAPVTEPGVEVYATEGAYKNPLDAQRNPAVMNGDPAGGYTVYDQSVTVYPLPGEEVPAYLPQYAVPPYAESTQQPAAQPVGQKPMGLASAGMLPPVPNVEVPVADPYAKPPVSGAVRQPLTLAVPEKPTLQPPVSARPPMQSPFTAAAPVADAPAPVDSGASAPVLEAPSVPDISAPGRRSSPMLTGY